MKRPSIQVIAGTNGAGKSSIAGAAIRERGGQYFNPDEAAREILATNPGISLVEANSAAWNEGRRLLETAIAGRNSFTFEATLGGNTITRLLERAHQLGIPVRMWFVGLNSVELHIARVRARVAVGGHDIPEAKIRERYDRSRENLIRLLPALTELHIYDNGAGGDPRTDAPRPTLILSVIDQRIVDGCPLADVPRWAKPVVMAALDQFGE